MDGPVVTTDEVNPIKPVLGTKEISLLKLPQEFSEYNFEWKVAKGYLDIKWTESGTAYGETDPTSQTVTVKVPTDKRKVDVTFHLDTNPVVRWGINFAVTVGVFKVEDDGEGHMGNIYMPATRSYDPAGRTGDPHASERIGDSCSCAQTFITAVELVAVRNGVDGDGLAKIQKAFRPLIDRYHGRSGLFEYMFRQIVSVSLEKSQNEVPYGAFLKSLPAEPKSDANEHTRLYMTSYDAGNPTPPLHFFRKVVAKESAPAFAKVLAQKESSLEEGHFPTFIVATIIALVVSILVMNHFTDPETQGAA
eukprot:m.120031 g.120031  ORF g.120031 m.120031 type:complete len:306 (+) comp13333_c0_seq2:2930-3847(+)